MRRGFLFFIVTLFFSCNPQPKLIKNQNVGTALGTTFSILYISDKELDYNQEIDSVFQAVNTSMSTYIPNSDISKINDGDTTVVIDAMFKEVFDISTQVHKASKGYFDPTIGVLANAWGFGPGEQLKLDSVKVDSLLTYVGWNKVSLNKNGTIKKANKHIRFDFNAVAKGYAIDRLGAFLTKKGVDNYLVEVGGEILAKGSNLLSKKEWIVGIDMPTSLKERGAAGRVYLKDKALASSGNYRKFRFDEETGEKYVHTINPLTGYTKNSLVLASSVIADDCATADAYATAFMVMNLEATKKLLATTSSIDAFIIYLDEQGNIKSYLTPGFKEILVD